MERPAFQFYPAPWLANQKLRRCSPAARGTWIDALCVFHESDEYGVIRYPLKELAAVIHVPVRLLQELADKGVLKGSDGHCPAFIYRPRHAGREGAPVVLIAENPGPCWYSSRMVRDEYIRKRSGGSTRFKSQASLPLEDDDEDAPGRIPTSTPSPRHGSRQGDGALSLSSSLVKPNPKSKPARAEIELPAWIPPELWQKWRDTRVAMHAKLTPHAEELGIRKLEQLRAEGADPIAVVEQSIEYGWKGFFRVKEEGNRDRRRETSIEAQERILGGITGRRGRTFESD